MVVFLALTEVFPCFFLSCKANARVKLAKTRHGPHSSTLVVICVVRLLFVLFYVLFVCKCVLPPGDNPIAVNKCITSSYHHISPILSVLLLRLSKAPVYSVPQIKCQKSAGKICYSNFLQHYFLIIIYCRPFTRLLRYKPEGRRFDSPWCYWNFPLT